MSNPQKNIFRNFTPYSFSGLKSFFNLTMDEDLDLRRVKEGKNFIVEGLNREGDEGMCGDSFLFRSTIATIAAS